MKPIKIDHPSVTVYEAKTAGELTVLHYKLEDDGQEVMLTVWQPSQEEIALIVAGRPVSLHIVGTQHPWVKLEILE